MSRSILIMAGGTGGHIFPALAVADILRSQGWQVTWLGVPHSMEADLVPRHGYEMAWVRFSGVRGKGLLRLLQLPFDLLVALWQSAAAIFRHRPDVVLGMGGYITFPGGLMAFLLRRQESHQPAREGDVTAHAQHHIGTMTEYRGCALPQCDQQIERQLQQSQQAL